MKRFHVFATHLLAITAIALSLVNCGGGGGSSAPAHGTLAGVVTDASMLTPAAISGATVTVFDADTNDVVTILTTNANGQYSQSLVIGSYYVKVAKQGFDSVPPQSLEPVPFSINSNQTTSNDIEMNPAANVNTGWISGSVKQGTSGVGGVLVVATDSGNAYSALSDASGNYVIYNVPVSATLSVTGYRAGYTASTIADVVVSQAVATNNVNLAMSHDATGQVPVSFNVNSQTGVTSPASMLVALIHPLTRETIPGLTQSKTYSPSISYSFGGVADGVYLVRASYANDTIVVDPDAIVKFGEPSVTVASGRSAPDPVDIRATSAVGLISPTNAMTSTVPVLISATPAPVFRWDAYPSTSDYVVEVMDATTGSVVWGGFSSNGTVKEVITTGTSITYAGPALESGHVYRWRVYASKDDNNATPKWRLISASEDQQGLIKIQ